MPHHQMQPLAIRQRGGQCRQFALAGLHEGRAQQQVFGRVAGQAELGRQRHTGAVAVGGPGRLSQQTGIAGQVAHGCIDLDERNLNGSGAEHGG